MSRATLKKFDKQWNQIFPMLIFLCPPLLYTSEVSAGNCYSAYKVKQDLEYSVNFALDLQENAEAVELIIHTRELELSDEEKIRLASFSNPTTIRAHLMLVSVFSAASESTKPNNKEEIFTHLFGTYSDAESGSLVHINSNSDETSKTTEHRSLYDLFQYSENSGTYRYRDGNGPYQVEIKTQRSDKTTTVHKTNMGYLPDANGNNSLVEILESDVQISIEQGSDACFFNKAVGSSTIESIMSATSMFTASANYMVELAPEHSLAESHFFHSLTTDMESWPNFEVIDTITQKEALEKLPYLMTRLSGVVGNDEVFLRTLKRNSNLMPHLAGFLSEADMSNDLSRQFFWALDRINSKATANALADISTRTLKPVDKFRSIMALSSTNSPLTASSVGMLMSHVQEISSYEAVTEEQLVFVRMLGAVVNRRANSDPISAGQIKEFLYAQANVASDELNTAIVSAIGNLKNSIDEQGRDILFESLDSDSESLRSSSASALTRVPYKLEDTPRVVDYIEKELNIEIQKSLVEALGNSEPSDEMAKQKLLSLVSTQNLSAKAIESLNEIDYALTELDINKLGTALINQSNTHSKKKLVSLILRNRKKP